MSKRGHSSRKPFYLAWFAERKHYPLNEENVLILNGRREVWDSGTFPSCAVHIPFHSGGIEYLNDLDMLVGALVLLAGSPKPDIGQSVDSAEMALEIAKAGWLYRQSTILRRWKKTWFVLYQDGDLRYFESPNSHEPEARIVVRAVCTAIHAGQICDIVPPEGKTKDCLIVLVLRDGELRLCAEDPDDMRAWQIALEEARVLPPGSTVQGLPPPYQGAPLILSQGTDLRQYPIQVGGTPNVVYPRQQVQYYYPGQVIQGPYGPVVAGGQPASNVVYVNQDPYLYRRRYDNSDLAVGMVAGAALGSMMWGPVLWW